MESATILERLIGFATVSSEPNAALIEWVRELLAAHGIESRLYPDPAAGKANLHAVIGPADRGGVMLSGHTDVVPVAGQRWSSDPFRMAERGGRLYGRGAADMKGFLACALRAARVAAGRPLRAPLHLALSYDEEVGCTGVRSLIRDMQTWTHLPRFCIVGEPTRLAIATAHKGKTALRATCHGRAAHSAAPDRGINAVHLACDLVGAIRERQRAVAASGRRAAGYEAPYSTLHVGTIQGGTALNVVPDRCEIELEIRNLPGEPPEALVEAIRCDAAAIARDGRIDIDVLQEYPGLDTSPDSDIVALAASITGNREVVKVGFGSEAGLFSARLGIPTVVCGPGSIEQAHAPDEFVSLEQLRRCDAMMDALLGVLESSA